MAKKKTSPENTEKERKMPVQGHLGELRSRIIKCCVALVITTSIGLVFYQPIFEFLRRPAEDLGLIFTDLTEFIGTYFRVALSAGIAVAMPYLVYQIFAFIAPGMTSKEKRYVLTMLPGVVIMFLLGCAFAYFVAMPPALRFLYTFGSDIATPMIKISNYVTVVIRLLLALGLVFETPIIIMALARMGLVTPQWLADKRKYWIVIAFIISALITPTFDPINQTIVAAPLIILYELSIYLSKIVYRERKPQVAPSTT